MRDMSCHSMSITGGMIASHFSYASFIGRKSNVKGLLSEEPVSDQSMMFSRSQRIMKDKTS